MVFAKPLSKILIVIYSNAISQFYDNNSANSHLLLPYEKNVSSKYYAAFLIQASPCKNGEIFRKEINRFFSLINLFLNN